MSMFEHFEKPDELFEYRLGMAMTMEHDSLDMLRELEMAAQSDEVKHLFSHHAQETQQQIANLEQAFRLLNIEPNDAPSPTTKGLAKEGTSLIRKSDDALHDDVALSAALGTEHFEISTYQTLIVSADSIGAPEVARQLTENLEQEKHTSEELEQTAKKLAVRRV
jgi:ferritin-like metal-binding protein YciE